jgi:hypothetical protein
MKDNLFVVVYVDNAIVCSKSKSRVVNFLEELKLHNYDFTEDGDRAAYLGVSITRLDNGSLLLRQQGLTNRIIALLGLNDGTPKYTPAMGPLGKCKGDPPATGEFNYCSALGMLMYLGNNSRPDCAFSIH